MECPACKNSVSTETEKCDYCEFPFNGSEKEKSIHIGKFINKRGVIFDANDSIRKSQNILLLVIGLNILGLIISYDSLMTDKFVLIINILIIISFAVCAFMIKKAPVLFTVIPLIIILSLYVINFIIDPKTIFSGIIMKLIIVGTLTYSIFLQISSDKFKKKFNH